VGNVCNLQPERGENERNNSAATQVKEEGAGAEIPLQPVVKTRVRQKK